MAKTTRASRVQPQAETDDREGWDCHIHVFDAARPVRGGHYQPGDARVEDVLPLAQASRIGRFVIVQPSVYGCDNGLLLDTLNQTGGRHRGVVVLDGVPTDRQLADWHALGVRGIRFNLYSPVGDRQGDWMSLAPRLSAAVASSGWHLQWYVQAVDLVALTELQARCAAPFVLDHYGSLGPTSMGDHRLRSAWHRLADAGAWVKLSAPYRVHKASEAVAWPHHVLHAAQVFGTRCIWGSDWPHTAFAPGSAPPYRALVEDVAGVLGVAAFAALVTENAERLYA